MLAIADQVFLVIVAKSTKNNVSSLVFTAIVLEVAVTAILVMEVTFAIVPSMNAELILAIIEAYALIVPMVTSADVYLELGVKTANKTTMTALTTLALTESALMTSTVIGVNVFPDIKDAIARLTSTSALTTPAKTEAGASTLWLDTNANAPVAITDPDANQMSTNAPPIRASMAVPVRTASAILFASAKRATKAKGVSKKSICANPIHANMAVSVKRISIPTLASANQAFRVKTARSTSMIAS